uniref:BESS domain-containing protein n=1 Tax=Salarias fasciatus TaxID=181472 RepID=A0A672GD48_SALFA
MAAALILSVFKYPELYNVTLPNYRCTESRASAWRSISSELGLSREYLFLFITSLLPLIICLAGVGVGNQTDRNRSSETSLSEVIKAPQSITKIPSLTPSSQNANSAKWLLKDNGASFPARPRDEDELFLLSFVPALKRLAPQKRCETKMKIQQIMYEAEFNLTDIFIYIDLE